MWKSHDSHTSVSTSEVTLQHGHVRSLCTVHGCRTAAALGGYSRHPTSHKAQKTHRQALSRKPVEPPAKRRRRPCPDPSAYIHVWMVRFFLGLPVSPEDTQRPHGAKADVTKAHCPPQEGGRAWTGPRAPEGAPRGTARPQHRCSYAKPSCSEPRALGVGEGREGRVSKANLNTADEAGSRGGSRAEAGGGLFTQREQPRPRGEAGSGPGLSIPWAQV